MLFLLLAACDTLEAPEACDDLVAPPVTACFGGDGLTWEGYGTLEVAVTGVVVDVATGARPEGCLVDVGNGQTGEGLVVTVEDGAGARYVVSFAVPGLAAPVAVGDPVALDLLYVYGEYAPDVGHARLSDSTGAPRVVVTEAGSLETLVLPDGVSVAEGASRCTEDDGCGVYSKYDLDVAVGDDAGGVRYGEEAALGGYRVVHGGFELQAEGQTDVCPDWFVAHATVGLVAE
ncbi:MAG: hypothetical protein ACK4YP_03955 [Myxococcota bacterium]